ncbi:MAG: hypothetical protein HOI65_13520 [Opitutae bacterium]|jgi:hypothetical protein|nr:hypothetical protein [Opitutae bacterium]MBT5692124.1 hypothetical protein [Opitutae bacterium]
MKTDMKSKLSMDLGLIKRRVGDQMVEMTECSLRYEQNLEVVFRRKEGIKDLPNQLLGGWKGYLLSRKHLLTGFSRDLQQKTTQARNFISFFSLRPGIIKLHVVNRFAYVLARVIRVILWAIFLALSLGVIISVFYMLFKVIAFIPYLIDTFISKEATDIPE